MTTNQARSGALRRDERAVTDARSGGDATPSSGGGEVLAVPTAAPRYSDDWGADELWGEPAPYVFDQHQDARTVEDFRHPWTRADKWIVGVLGALLVLAWFAGMAGRLS